MLMWQIDSKHETKETIVHSKRLYYLSLLIMFITLHLDWAANVGTGLQAQTTDCRLADWLVVIKHLKREREAGRHTDRRGSWQTDARVGHLAEEK